MDKLAPFQTYHNPSPNQNPLTHRPKQTSFNSLASPSLALAPISPDTAPLSASPLPQFQPLNPLKDVKTLESVKIKHAQILKTRNSDSKAESLITSYLELGEFRTAAMVFFVGYARNYVAWSSFLDEFQSFGGDPVEILKVFQELNCKGVVFDSEIVTIILKICIRVMDVWLGLEVHASLVKRGFELDVYVRSALLNYYQKCWDVDTANQLFDEMSVRNDLLWNEAIMINLKNERFGNAVKLFREMQFSSAKAKDSTILKMLQACGKEGALNEGKQIHGYVIRNSLESNLYICNSLIIMYSRDSKLRQARIVFDSMKNCNVSSWNSIISSYAALGQLNDAWELFHEMELSSMKPDIITWNSLLSGCALNGLDREVLVILHKMQVAGFRPNSSSVTSVLQAVIELKLLKFGKEIHGYVIRNGLNHDVYVETSLLDMYVKNDCLPISRRVFDSMKKNIVAWNSLITGYAYKGLFHDAERLLEKMEEEGIRADIVTWNGLVYGYSMWGDNEEAMAIINEIRNSGLTPNVVSWTALISGSSQNGKFKESLEYFIQMQQQGIKPNSTTITNLLRTCGGLSLLKTGKEIHCLSVKTEFVEDAYVATALIDIYSKLGDLRSGCEVFRKIKNKTLACWNCMIMGFAIYGLRTEAISLYDKMRQVGIMPDSITFTALLSACKNSGLVTQGWNYFDSMKKDYSIEPTIEHYSCMVDLLGRAGYLDEAWDFIQTMPVKPDATIWGAFLGSCRIYTNLEYAETAAEELFKLEPYNSANYHLMMNLYAMSNRWDDVKRVRDLMDNKGVKSREVWSYIQIDREVHRFFAWGKPHQDEGEIYFELYRLVAELKKVGYVPDINCVLLDIEEEEKEKVLLSHTEKLAITYGLIKREGGAPIRVIKNSRICSDCHTAAKLISLVRSVEIILKDGVRFHYFRSGECSCNDFW
ncbi:pentatricopeptide repeat-containing protein At4g01030, mitochondrial [Mercurialis annua]|uniref:pentatricopeptide repeat-containing protein At4g01030, mitochondrial n=1 Tax=Mercurialis annua TaxID=3986 RepID=UPI00215FDB87|nr:pentatricopeptide repeat-containing protein At4g01030, mitochondrial [Mercurialis annua]